MTRLLLRSALVCVLAGTLSAQERAIVHRTPPEYPPLAVRMRVSGTVKVAAVVDAEGAVKEAHATAGHAMLRPAAEAAVLQWKFAGASKPTDMTIDVHFQLDAGSTR